MHPGKVIFFSGATQCKGHVMSTCRRPVYCSAKGVVAADAFTSVVEAAAELGEGNRDFTNGTEPGVESFETCKHRSSILREGRQWVYSNQKSSIR